MTLSKPVKLNQLTEDIAHYFYICKERKSTAEMLGRFAQYQVKSTANILLAQILFFLYQ